MKRWLALALCVAFPPGAALAQEAPAVLVEQADGAVLRVLDRVSGELVDLTLATGQASDIGRIRIGLLECRYPADDPAGDAFAFVTIWTDSSDTPDFSGWMVSSSPALNALDHPRYDVWVRRCTSS